MVEGIISIMHGWGCDVSNMGGVHPGYRGLAWAAAVTLTSGCGMTLRSDIHDPDPAAKIPALVHAANRPTGEELRALVKALDHDDAAVRLFAIESLQRATGESHGFRPYDAEADRERAVARWRAWLDDQDQGRRIGGHVTAAHRPDEHHHEDQAHGSGR